MALSVETKAKIVAEFARGERDTGSPEVQIALLTYRIADLQPHFQANKKIITAVAVCCAWLLSVVSFSTT